MLRRQKQRRETQKVSARQRVTDHESGSVLAYLDIPDGVEVYKITKAGVYEFDIIPFLAGEGNPFQKNAGEPHYERTFWTHRSLGADNTQQICLSKTFHTNCPVCEYRSKLVKQPDHDEKEVKNLNPSERQIFNIIDLKNRDKGIQIFPYSYWLFGKVLDGKVKKYGDGRYDLFADLKDGLSLRVEFDEDKIGTFTCFRCSGIEFSPRRKPYNSAMLTKAICLDDIIKKITYKKLKGILEQTAAEINGEEDDEEESLFEDNGEEEESPRRSKKKSKKFNKEEFDEDEDTADYEEEEFEDIDEEEDDEEEWSDAEEDDEEEEAPRRKKKTKPTLTAKKAGIKVGTKVKHPEHGVCKVIHVTTTGDALRIKDSDGEIHKAIKPSAVKVIGKKRGDDWD